MKTLAEEIVSDFGIKDFIDKNIKDCVEKLASYSGENRIDDTLNYLDRLIRISPSTNDWRRGIKKYSSLLKTRPEMLSLTNTLSGYIYSYILSKASDSGISINE